MNITTEPKPQVRPQTPQSRPGWEILSLQRKKLMGLAAVLVVLYHFTAELTRCTLPSPVIQAARWLYACAVPLGVAIFLFMSGMGLYFAMMKGPSLREFYRNRYLSLLITYGLWGFLFWTVADYFIRGAGEKRFLTDLLLLSFWRNGDHSFWYVAVVIVFFLLYPLLFRLLRGENRFRLLNYLLLLGLDAGICFALKAYAPGCYANIEICLLRFPVYLAGIWYGDKIYRRLPFSLIDRLLIALILLARLLSILYYTCYGYTPWIYQRVLCDYASLVFMLLAAWIFTRWPLKRITKALTTVSAISLELYLTHLSIWNLLSYFNLHRPFYFILLVGMALVLSAGLHLVSADLVIRWKASVIPFIDRKLQSIARWRS